MYTKVTKTSIKELAECRRAIVLSPHPDDETIGCGGILHCLNQRGVQISFMFISSGEKGLNSRLRNNAPLLREKDVPLALRKLKFTEPQIQFLRVPDGEVSAHKEFINVQIQNCIRDYAPDLILVPSFYEEHPDHVAVSIALGLCSGLTDLTISMYEVWSPLRPNYLFRINDCYEYKLNALEQYKTQLVFKIKEMAKALAAYRGSRMLGIKHQYCEAFYICSGNDYVEQLNRFQEYIKDNKNHTGKMR